MAARLTRLAVLVSRSVLSLGLIVAGGAKLLDPSAFTWAILGYQVVDLPFAAAIALFLPWLEVAVGTALAVPRWRSAGYLLALGLGMVFVAAAGSAAWRGIEGECGCFGPARASWLPGEIGLTTPMLWAGVTFALALHHFRAQAKAGPAGR